MYKGFNNHLTLRKRVFGRAAEADWERKNNGKWCGARARPYPCPQKISRKKENGMGVPHHIFDKEF